MANAEKVSNEALVSVVAQINKRIASVARDLLTKEASEGAIPRKIDLGETFAVWALRTDKIRSGVEKDEDLVKLAANTRHWHHQIRFDGKGLAYARSKPGEGEGNERWKLCELGVSTLAAEIQAASEWSDDNVPDDYLMRLLVVPSRQVRAFWFIDEPNQTSHVYIINSPPYFKDVWKKRSMSSREFLTALAAERPISGYNYEDEEGNSSSKNLVGKD